MFMTAEQVIFQSENKASKADVFSDDKQSNKNWEPNKIIKSNLKTK